MVDPQALALDPERDLQPRDSRGPAAHAGVQEEQGVETIIDARGHQRVVVACEVEGAPTTRLAAGPTRSTRARQSGVVTKRLSALCR